MKHASHVSRPAGPGLFAARDFLLLWTVGGIGNAMRWLEVLAAALFTLDATGSAFATAAVSAARALPLTLTGALAGVLADAVSRKAIVVGGMLLSAAAAACVGVLAWAGLVQPWHLFAASLASGLVYGTEMPARRRMVGESVAPALVARAVAMDSLTSSATRAAGPLLGGAAYQFLGLSGTFLGSAALSLVAAGLALRLHHVQGRRPLTAGIVIADLGEALRLVRGSAVLLALIATTFGQNLFGFAYTALIAPLGHDVFARTAAWVGLLAAAEPAGASTGGLVMALGGKLPGQPTWLMLGGAAVFLSLLLVLPAAPYFPAAAVLLFAGGLGIAVYSNEQTTIALRESPPALRSRVMGLLTVAIGTWPLGMLLAGWLGERVGPLYALGALGAGGLLWLLGVGLGYARRPRRLTDPQQAG